MHINLLYFKRQIFEELEGAREYIMMAIEDKPTNPSRAKIFVEMSAAELNHAATLYKMFEECYRIETSKREATTPYLVFLEDMRAEVIDDYLEESSKVKYMHECFNK